ncbi:MAG TPA: DJ-1 family glyoxalase III [Nitrospinaceae bacterium]|nr:DJ-1 family glyoxalase III [Nitrospinaceae bacterium]
MKKVLVPLAPGFEEIETITVVDILRRSGARVTLAGTIEGPIEGSRGVRVLPDEPLNNVLSDELDLVVLPGGQPGTDNLKNNPRISSILVEMKQGKKLIAAICAAPVILEKNGLLNNRNRTSHPSVKEGLTGSLYLEDRVVVDGNIITSRAPGTAMEFALTLVEILFSKDRVDTVNKGVMAKL